MKHKALQFSSIAAGIAFLAVFFGAAIHNTPATNAISATDFKAGNIIDDGVFYNKNTMTVAEIQAHLNRYMPACDTWGTGAVGSGRYINGKAVPASTTRAEYARQMRAAGNSRYHEPPYVCVQNYYENPATHETLYETKNVIKDGMISAAQIIYNASQKNGINPQVLLVLLKKESYVWGDNWPLKDEYNTVMGYACPDTAPCNSKYFGFYNQVEMAAWQLNYYKEHIYSYNYRPYATNSILYSPTTSCGRKSVYLENLATTSLYIYTPYTPNDAALRNYPGTATCGSYGNRNFFMYFSEWFGSTHNFSVSKRTIPEMDYRISSSDTTKTLYIENDSKNSSAKLVSGDNSVSSVFSFKHNADNSYTITNKNSGLALAIPDTGAILGAQVQQVKDTGATAQKWFVYTDGAGGYYIASATSAAYVLSIKDDGNVTLDVYGSQSSKPLKLTPVIAEKIANGNYIIESALKKNYVLDMYGNSANEGINITTYSANGTSAQLYEISYDEKSSYYIIKSNYNKVISAKSKPVQNGTNIQTNKDTAECTQRFLISKDAATGNYVFTSSCDLSYVFDVNGAVIKDGTNVSLWSYNGSTAQRWSLIPYKTTSEKAAEESLASGSETKSEPTEPATTEPSKQLIADGDYIIHSTLKPNYVIDVSGASKANGANIQMWPKNNTVAQTFSVKYNSQKDAYMFVSPYSNHAIDLYGAVTSNGMNIHSWSVNGTCAQYWKIVKKTANIYTIPSSCNEKYVLDVAGAGTKNGTNIHLYQSNGTKAQEWTFEKK